MQWVQVRVSSGSCYLIQPPPQPFYGPFSGTTQMSRCQKRTFGLYGARKDQQRQTMAIRLGATPSWPTSAHLHYPPFFTGRLPFLPPNRQCQRTEGLPDINVIICPDRIQLANTIKRNRNGVIFVTAVPVKGCMSLLLDVSWWQEVLDGCLWNFWKL